MSVFEIGTVVLEKFGFEKYGSSHHSSYFQKLNLKPRKINITFNKRRLSIKIKNRTFIKIHFINWGLTYRKRKIIAAMLIRYVCFIKRKWVNINRNWKKHFYEENDII